MAEQDLTTSQIIPPSPRERGGGMRIRNLAPRLPERGKIKIGIKASAVTSSRGNEFQPPQKLDHFRVVTLERGKDGNFLIDEAFHKCHGQEPKEIPVRLLYDDPDLNFPTRYACFLGRTLWCSGNGETATRISDSPPRNRAELEQLKPEPRLVKCPCHRIEATYDGKDRCKPNGALSVLIDGAGGLGGVWTFRTTSWNSIAGIMSTLEFLSTVTGGILSNIPLKLRIMPKQATNPVNGSQVTIYVVGLEFDGDIPQLQQIGHDIALERARTHVSIKHIEAEARRLLAAPTPNAVLPGDDADDVIDEFYYTDQPAEREGAVDLTEPQERTGDEEFTPFVVVDLAGEFVEFDDDAEAADRLREVQDEAEAQRGDQGVQAIWESNAQLIYELRERGHDDVADAANAYYAERLANAEQHPHTGRERSREAPDPNSRQQERKLPPEPGRTPRGLPFPSDEILPRGHNETGAPAADNPGEGTQPTQTERTESKSADLSHPNKASTPAIPPRGTSAPHAARDEKFWEPLPGKMPKEILYYAQQSLLQCRDQTDVDGIAITNKDRFAKLLSEEADKKKIKEMIAQRRAELAQ